MNINFNTSSAYLIAIYNTHRKKHEKRKNEFNFHEYDI